MKALSLKEVILRTSLRKSAVYQKIREGTFPAPAKLGGGSRSAWLESEVEAWISKQFLVKGTTTKKGKFGPAWVPGPRASGKATKKCQKCSLTKTGFHFYESKRSVDGLTTWCADCLDWYHSKEIAPQKVKAKTPIPPTPVAGKTETSSSSIQKVVDSLEALGLESAVFQVKGWTVNATKII